VKACFNKWENEGQHVTESNTAKNSQELLKNCVDEISTPEMNKKKEGRELYQLMSQGRGVNLEVIAGCLNEEDQDVCKADLATFCAEEYSTINFLDETDPKIVLKEIQQLDFEHFEKFWTECGGKFKTKIENEELE
jgi:hypothetical protein